jgi:hypothetical protein
MIYFVCYGRRRFPWIRISPGVGCVVSVCTLELAVTHG